MCINIKYKIKNPKAGSGIEPCIPRIVATDSHH